MLLNTKVKLAHGTLYILSGLAALVAMGVVGIVACATFHVNPFNEHTTDFLIAAIVGLVGLGLVALALNVAANISIIADSKVANIQLENGGYSLKNVIATCAVVVAVIFAGVWGAAYISDAVLKQRLVKFAGALPVDYVSELQMLEKNLAKTEKIENIKSCRNMIYTIPVILTGDFVIDDLMYSYKKDSTSMAGILEVGILDNKQMSESDDDPYTHSPFRCKDKPYCEVIRSFLTDSTSAIPDPIVSNGRCGWVENVPVVYTPLIVEGRRLVAKVCIRSSYGKIGS